ncbi:hypothetical protein ACFOKI_13725 [Sphingomonas qilianensis]|uniref:Uncharacterized protein n=1 Tax=Sphingomonas qilianensis TaxID=1736690 RepID=A0ABU9XMZ9_9SPHN
MTTLITNISKDIVCPLVIGQRRRHVPGRRAQAAPRYQKVTIELRRSPRTHCDGNGPVNKGGRFRRVIKAQIGFALKPLSSGQSNHAASAVQTARPLRRTSRAQQRFGRVDEHHRFGISDGRVELRAVFDLRCAGGGCGLLGHSHTAGSSHPTCGSDDQ